jgi:methyl-accepting chemotaxis protein
MPVKISTKLAMSFVGVIVVFCALAAVLVAQIRGVTRGYNALLNSEVQEVDAARVVQVNFKKQVQEWKDILLRGHSPEDLARYTAQFHEEEVNVQTGASVLESRLEDAQARGLVQQFVNAHQILGQKYQAAYEAYLAGNADFKTADRLVRGQDRAPTDLFDAVVARLDARLKSSVAEQQHKVRQSLILTLGVCGGLLLLVSGFGILTVRSILGRLASLRSVSDHLARADVEGLTIDISGKDEIGEFAESLARVHAAIQELLQDSPAPVATFQTR